jgi:hypothetical protein
LKIGVVATLLIWCQNLAGKKDNIGFGEFKVNHFFEKNGIGQNLTR